MYLKISILLLTCLICYTESVPSKRNINDVLEKYYGIAKKKLKIPNERGFNEDEMAKYAGINVAELKEIANSVSIKDLENINLDTFKLLVSAIKKKRLWKPKKGLKVGPCKTPTYNEDGVLETAYSILKVVNSIPEGSGINASQMASHAGISELELKEIANSIAIENLDNINLEMFKLLVTAISKKNDVSIREPQSEQEAGPSNKPTLDEDGVLKAVYYACKMYLNIPNERYLNESEMAKFMEIDVSELRKIANSISIKDLDSINLEKFILLATAISEKRGVSIREPQGDLGAGSSDRFTIDEDDILEMAYNIAKIDNRVSSGRGLNESQMASCAGITVLELEKIANLISIENLDNINLKNFVLLAKKISELKDVPITDSMDN